MTKHDDKNPAGEESLKEDYFNCKIYTPDGLFQQIEVRAKVPLPPQEVYAILTDPYNRQIFKSIKSVEFRHVLADYTAAGYNRQLVELEQTGIFKFLFFSGSFPVHTFVDQNADTLNMKFWAAKQGFMKVFDGEWVVRPWSQESFNELNAELDPKQGTHVEFPLKDECANISAALHLEKSKISDKKAQQNFEWRPVTSLPEGGLPSSSSSSPQASPPKPPAAASATGGVEAASTHENPTGKNTSPKNAASTAVTAAAASGVKSKEEVQGYSLVTLRQRVQPSISPPPLVAHFVRKVTGSVVSRIVKDLVAHANEVDKKRRSAVQQSMTAHVLDDLDLTDESESDEAPPSKPPPPDPTPPMADLSLAWDENGEMDEARLQMATALFVEQATKLDENLSNLALERHGGTSLDHETSGVEGGMAASAASPKPAI